MSGRYFGPALKAQKSELSAVRASLDAGDYFSAERALTELLQGRPKNAEAMALKGAVLTRMGRHEEALTACRKAMRINPKCGDAYVALGETYFRQENYKDAIATLVVGLAHPMSNPREANLFLADACIMAENLEGATAALEAAGTLPGFALSQRYSLLLDAGLNPPKLSGCA